LDGRSDCLKTPGLKLVELSPPLGIAWFCLFCWLFLNQNGLRAERSLRHLP
jgi:hypothetical protein